MIKPKVLVTSAAGRTGAAAVLALLELGFPVRAMVRRNDQRSSILEKSGAEIFIGDQWSFTDLRCAMSGVQRAYHCPPFAPNLLENLMLFALAAEEARLEVVALMSAWNTVPEHASISSRSHWIANHIYRLMPNTDVIHINPGLFAFVYFLGLPAIVNFGMLMAPFGQGLNAPPANEDIGFMAAHVLANPAAHIGKSYRPTGPDLLSPEDIAAVFSRILERKVSYRNVPFGLFAKAAKAQGFPMFDISQVQYFAEELKQGAYAVGGVTDHVERVTGRAAEPFESLARRYISNPALIHPNLEGFNTWKAVGLLMKILLTKGPDLSAWERQQHYPVKAKQELAQQNEQWHKKAKAQELNILPYFE